MDRFDDIWKNRFNEEDFPVGDWNAPDDEVWKSIEVEISPKKDRRRSFWFWLGLGSLLLLFSTAILFGTGKLGQSANLVSEEKATSQLIDKKTSNNNSIAENTVANTTEVTDAKSEITFKAENISVNISPFADRNISKNNNTITISETPRTTNVFKNKSIISNTIATQSVEAKNILSNSLKTKNTIPLDGMSKRAKETIYMIPNSVLILNEPFWTHPILNLQLLADDDFIKSLNPESYKFGKIRLGANAGVTFWNHRISDKYTSDLSPFDFNYEDGIGWQTNLNLNISLGKKWDAFVGVQYEQVKTTSGHNSALTYSPDSEVTDPLNGYVLSLATPYGLSGATFNFNRVEEVGTDDVDLLVDFHSDHMIKNISIPVGAMFYPLGKNRKFTPSATLGFGVNYLQGISNKIGSIETNHSAIQFDDSGSSTFVDAEIKNWHYDFRMGAGVNYHFNRYFNLNLNYNFSRGINPIFELDQYNTRIDRHHISLGLTTKFSR